MTLETQIPRVVIIGNGTRGPYSLVDENSQAIRFVSTSHVRLKRFSSTTDEVGDTLTETTDYTVGGTQDARTFTLTSAQAVLASTERIVADRNQTYIQDLDLTTGGAYVAESQESRHDKVAEYLQEVKTLLARKIEASPLDSTPSTFPLKANATSGDLLAFDDDKNLTPVTPADISVTSVLLGSGWATDLLASKVDRTFMTRTAAAAATINAATQRIRVMGYATIFDGGGAVYKRISTPSPVRAWHFASADGAYWEIDERIWFPEMVAALGDGATDDTTALQNYNLAMESHASLNMLEAHFRADATYWVLPDGMSNGTVVFDLDNPKGLKIVGNNATISARLSETGKVHYGFLIDGAEKCSIRGLKFEQPNLAASESEGCKWIVGRVGFNDNDIQIECTSGLTAVQISRVVGSGTARSSGNRVHVRTDETHYGLVLGSDGDNTEATLICNDVGRAIIYYNQHGLKARILVTNPREHTQVAATCYGNDSASDLDVKETTGFDVHYTDRSSTTWTDTPLVFYCSHQQDDATGDFSTHIAGRIGVDLSSNGAATGQWRELFINVSFIWDTPGSTQQEGEPTGGNTEDVEVYGFLEGDLDATGGLDAINLGSTTYGWGTASDLRWTFRDFHAPDLTRPMNLGRVQRVNIVNTSIPSVAVTFEASFPAANFIHSNSQISGITVASSSAFSSMSPRYIYHPVNDSLRCLDLDGLGNYHGLGLRVSGTLKFRAISDTVATFLRAVNNLVLGADETDLLTLDTGKFYPNTDNSVDLGDSTHGYKDLYLAGVMKVDNTQVVGAQQSAIADLAWTYSANDPGTTPNSAVTFADGNALAAATAYEAFDEIEGKINAILAALRTHGLIDT